MRSVESPPILGPECCGGVECSVRGSPDALLHWSSGHRCAVMDGVSQIQGVLLLDAGRQLFQI